MFDMKFISERHIHSISSSVAPIMSPGNRVTGRTGGHTAVTKYAVQQTLKGEACMYSNMTINPDKMLMAN